MENEVFIFSYKFFYKVILILSIKCSFNFLKKKFYENFYSCKVFFLKDYLYFMMVCIFCRLV